MSDCAECQPLEMPGALVKFFVFGRFAVCWGCMASRHPQIDVIEAYSFARCTISACAHGFTHYVSWRRSLTYFHAERTARLRTRKWETVWAEGGVVGAIDNGDGVIQTLSERGLKGCVFFFSFGETDTRLVWESAGMKMVEKFLFGGLLPLTTLRPVLFLLCKNSTTYSRSRFKSS